MDIGQSYMELAEAKGLVTTFGESILFSNQGIQSVGVGNTNTRDYLMEVEVPTNEAHGHGHAHVHDPQEEYQAVTQPLTSFTLHESYINYSMDTTPKRKFCSLTQRRKKLIDKYINEVLTKSHEYDYGEFGSSLWSALLLEYFREDKDQHVGIDSIMHWARHTSWGRRMRKAYEIGILSIKEGLNPVREFELAKHEVFQKHYVSESADESYSKMKGRRRKMYALLHEPDPTVVIGVLNDHDYCKNPWLEAFGEAYALPVIESPLAYLESESTERVYDMGAIGGEVEI